MGVWEYMLNVCVCVCVCRIESLQGDCYPLNNSGVSPVHHHLHVMIVTIFSIPILSPSLSREAYHGRL